MGSGFGFMSVILGVVGSLAAREGGWFVRSLVIWCLMDQRQLGVGLRSIGLRDLGWA